MARGRRRALEFSGASRGEGRSPRGGVPVQDLDPPPAPRAGPSWSGRPSGSTSSAADDVAGCGTSLDDIHPHPKARPGRGQDAPSAPAGAGSVVNRCRGGWSAVADGPPPTPDRDHQRSRTTARGSLEFRPRHPPRRQPARHGAPRACLANRQQHPQVTALEDRPPFLSGSRFADAHKIFRVVDSRTAPRRRDAQIAGLDDRFERRARRRRPGQGDQPDDRESPVEAAVGPVSRVRGLGARPRPRVGFPVVGGWSPMKLPRSLVVAVLTFAVVASTPLLAGPAPNGAAVRLR